VASIALEEEIGPRRHVCDAPARLVVVESALSRVEPSLLHCLENCVSLPLHQLHGTSVAASQRLDEGAGPLARPPNGEVLAEVPVDETLEE
jgi:hypothetical protein